MIAAAAAVLLLIAPQAWAQPTSPAPLTPEELLSAVTRAMPLLERARQDIRLAEGALVETQGAFDLSLTAGGKADRGYYDNEQYRLSLEQPLALFGIDAYGGYRLGRGLFAPYAGKSATLSEGEFNVGFAVPLLRDRDIDERRAAREIATLGLDVAQRDYDTARLGYLRDALEEYWDWSAAGLQRGIAQDLLALATARDQQLADAVALGQVAAVERTDNVRAILQRRSAVVSAVRQVELKAIDVSLYLRGPDGQPIRPALDRVPPLPRPLGDSTEPDEVDETATALERRPELRALRTKLAQQTVALRAAENAWLPSLDLYSEFARDFGSGPESRAGSGFQGGVTFGLPVQRRRARGKTLQAEAKRAALAEQLRWAEDRVRADVQDALSAQRAAREVLDVIGDEVRVTRELEQLERDRFALGDSTQFLINLRELATADALLREARALADYQKALVKLDAATGRLLDRAP